MFRAPDPDRIRDRPKGTRSSPFRPDLSGARRKGKRYKIMKKMAMEVQRFKIMDCAPVQIATGLKSYSLRELRDSIAQVHPGSLYHHFWGRMISPTFDEPEYTNDFAAWSYHEMHDKTTAEMLSSLRPKDFDSIQSLRTELLEILVFIA